MATSRLKQRGGAAGGGGTGGQHLEAKPVTSPVSARATEPRKPEAVLELRRGARFGSGAGPDWRQRRDSQSATKTLRSRGWARVATEGAAVAAGAEGEPVVRGGCSTTRTSRAHDPGEAERDGVLERVQHRELGCKLTQLITARHEAKRGRGAPKRRAENALRAKGRGDDRCSKQRSARAKPPGHQSGEPPWAAVAKRRAGEATGSQERRDRTGQVHGRRQAGRQAQEESPQRGLDVQVQIGQEFRHGSAGSVFAVQCVSISPV